MRIEYKRNIFQRLRNTIDAAQEANKQIDTIYLNTDEWIEFKYAGLRPPSLDLGSLYGAYDGVTVRPETEQGQPLDIGCGREPSKYTREPPRKDHGN